MHVTVRLNGSLDVPFIIDTGATSVVVPMNAAKELGLPVEGPGVRKVSVRTANGVVEVPVVMLDSVQMGSAIVRDVSGIAMTTMTTGLLGLSFFNNFTYNIDAQRGLVTLTENDLAAQGILRGGRSRAQWVAEFRGHHLQIETAEQLLDEVSFGRSRERARAEERVSRIRGGLRALESEADDAHVPFSWRD